ncbi:MAG: type II toxin-antitoxin system VapC family toxin [Bryobacteraceae bacterium]
MLILDTQILAEVIRLSPDPKIGAWLGTQPRDDLYTTSLAQADILYNVERLPPGKRRSDLLSAVAEIFAFFDKRVLPFDPDAARAYPQIILNRKMMGQPIEPANAMLAAITRSRGATLATRNTEQFSGCGIRVVNPWES